MFNFTTQWIEFSIERYSSPYIHKNYKSCVLEWRFSEREFSGGSLGSISIIFHLTGKQQIKAFFVISSQPYELELYRISPPKYCSPVHQNDDEVWTLSMRAKTINDQFFKFRITDVSMKKFQRWRRTVNYSPLCRVFI